MAAASTSLVPAKSQPAPSSVPKPLDGFQQCVLAVLQTITFTSSGNNRLFRELIAEYSTNDGQMTPAEECMIEKVGLERVAKLPCVTSVALNIDQHFPWVIDETFPAVDPTLMPANAVRGESSIKKDFKGVSFQVHFIAIRYISITLPEKQYVELVYFDQHKGANGQNLFGRSTELQKADFERLRDMLDGATITGSPDCMQTGRYRMVVEEA